MIFFCCKLFRLIDLLLDFLDLLAVYDDECGPGINVDGPQPSGASNSLGALGVTLEKFEVSVD